MQLKSVAPPSRSFLQKPSLRWSSRPSVQLDRTSGLRCSVVLQRLRVISVKNNESQLVTSCGRSGRDLSVGGTEGLGQGSIASVSTPEGGNGAEVMGLKREELVNRSIWKQMQEILMFSGPATGIWICGPSMSLLSTAVIGRGSSTELSALGLATVLCDNLNLLFMFLSISTSNMVATALAKRDEVEAQHQLSILLFVGLTCGILMLLFTQFFASRALSAFAGPKNVHIVSVATKYVQIRGLAWPAVLYGLVAQSASLGMKNSSGPLKALIVAIIVNGIGHLVLCNLMGYGIKGAAFATMTSQFIAAYMMIEALNRKGYSALSIAVPSAMEFQKILEIAAPVFVSMLSKVAFYSLITYCATAMGTYTVAAHQVMIQTYAIFVVWGEPLSQSAQSFMPELLCGVKQNLEQARMLLKSLVIIGAILGTAIGAIGMSIPWFFPYMFTQDINVIQEMHKVLILFFLALWVTPCTHSLEGTLLAGRELKFISLSMFGCLSLATILLLVMVVRGYGLTGCWLALVGFQWARFLVALTRVLSPSGILSRNEYLN